MGNNIRSSSRPKALAPSIPMPPRGGRDGRSPSQRGSVLSSGRGRGLGRDDEEDATTCAGPDIAAMGTVEVIAGAGHIARSATTAAK